MSKVPSRPVQEQGAGDSSNDDSNNNSSHAHTHENGISSRKDGFVAETIVHAPGDVDEPAIVAAIVVGDRPDSVDASKVGGANGGKNADTDVLPSAAGRTKQRNNTKRTKRAQKLKSGAELDEQFRRLMNGQSSYRGRRQQHSAAAAMKSTEERALEECVFKPTLCAKSSKLAAKARRRSNSSTATDQPTAHSSNDITTTTNTNTTTTTTNNTVSYTHLTLPTIYSV